MLRIVLGLLLCVCVSCGQGAAPAKAPVSTTSTTSQLDSASDSTGESASESTTIPKRKFSAVALAGENESSNAAGGAGAKEHQVDDVISALKPLQVLLGQWRGTTNKKFKGFSAVEELEWVWDFRTNKDQPALVMQSDKSPYIRSARLTYLTDKSQFEMELKTPEETTHVLTGTFAEEPEDFTGDDNKPQRSYKLLLSEAGDGAVLWQVALNQQENNRYLVEVSQKKGTGSFQRVDTVGTQRSGSSIAANDEDFGERTCIISGGLGTISVSYEGKSYFVCCTGCEAAFKDDPKRWLAKLAENAKK